MGMYVVAKLAYRHGLTVELIRGVPGITAKVTIPRDHLEIPKPPEPDPGKPSATSEPERRGDRSHPARDDWSRWLAASLVAAPERSLGGRGGDRESFRCAPRAEPSMRTIPHPPPGGGERGRDQDRRSPPTSVGARRRWPPMSEAHAENSSR